MKNLNMDFWRAVFAEQMRLVKPRDAWRLTKDQTLEYHQVPSGWKRSLQEHACARFICSQCHHNWTSHQVVILFHMHWEPYGRQGCVRMRFFQQQCYKCFSEKYEEPQFTEESVGDVLERLVTTIRKKCYRENIISDSYKSVPLRSGPHKPENCEACQLGIHKRYWPQGAGHHWESSNWDPESTQFSEAFNLIDTPVSSPIVDSTPPGSWKRCAYIISISIIVTIILAIIFYYLFIHLAQAP